MYVVRSVSYLHVSEALNTLDECFIHAQCLFITLPSLFALHILPLGPISVLSVLLQCFYMPLDTSTEFPDFLSDLPPLQATCHTQEGQRSLPKVKVGV